MLTQTHLEISVRFYDLFPGGPDRAFQGLLCRAGSVSWEESHKRCHSGAVRKLRDSAELAGSLAHHQGILCTSLGSSGENRVGRKWVATLKVGG